MNTKNIHEFALYVTDLPGLKPGTLYTLKDQDLIHRMLHVLRLQQDDQFILFSRTHAFVCTINTYLKKELIINIITPKQVSKIMPVINVFLPMLKRTALEEALYSCTELGAQVIQLIYTDKTPHTKVQPKDLERYQRIIISAAEQCKHFCFPELRAPIMLEKALKNINPNVLNIFGDPEGNSYTTLLDAKNPLNCKEITILVGPEGDLTPEEKLALKEYNFNFVHLTPTILRAQQALTVLLGIIRSL